MIQEHKDLPARRVPKECPAKSDFKVLREIRVHRDHKVTQGRKDPRARQVHRVQQGHRERLVRR